MIVAVDIGNTCLKCRIFLPDEEGGFISVPIPPEKVRRTGNSLHKNVSLWLRSLTDERILTPDVYSTAFTWRIAVTGRFPWQEFKAEILKIRPQDDFKRVVRQQIPLKIDVDVPEKVGIDRLLAAFAAIKRYGDLPMLIVDAGTAITVDVVQDQTFCGGAILPGLTALSATYPQISKKLPLVAIPGVSTDTPTKPSYPGKNTKEAIQSGLYWGIVGAIRQFYKMFCSNKRGVRLILTGGHAEYLLPGLAGAIPKRQIKHHEFLVLEGIHQC
jgi:type III pantothenate kinase